MRLVQDDCAAVVVDFGVFSFAHFVAKPELHVVFPARPGVPANFEGHYLNQRSLINLDGNLLGNWFTIGTESGKRISCRLVDRDRQTFFCRGLSFADVGIDRNGVGTLDLIAELCLAVSWNRRRLDSETHDPGRRNRRLPGPKLPGYIRAYQRQSQQPKRAEF